MTSLLFTIKSAEGQTAGYLLGSCHVLPKDSCPIGNDIESALKNSSCLALERDMTHQETASKWQAFFAGYHQGKIKQLLPSASNEEINTIVERIKRIGMASDDLGEKEWGIDYQLANRVQGKGKIISLETIEQFKAITSPILLPDETYSRLLKCSDTAVSYMASQLREGHRQLLSDYVCAWNQGGLPSEELLREADEVRNQNMASRIDELITKEGEKPFCCVGYDHCYGLKRIPGLLIEKGYSVERTELLPKPIILEDLDSLGLDFSASLYTRGSAFSADWNAYIPSEQKAHEVALRTIDRLNSSIAEAETKMVEIDTGDDNRLYLEGGATPYVKQVLQTLIDNGHLIGWARRDTVQYWKYDTYAVLTKATIPYTKTVK